VENKIIKMALLSSLIVALILTQCIFVFGGENNKEIDARTLLIQNGYSEDTVDVLPQATQEQIASDIRENPQSVSIQSVVDEIDNLTGIEDVISLSDDEIANLDTEEATAVESLKDDILEIYDSNDSVLVQRYDFSPVEIKLFDKAVEEGLENNGDNQEQSDEINDVTASGTIASSKLTFTLSITSHATSTYPILYNVKTSFCWKTPPIVALPDDTIAIGWAGLNLANESGAVDYSEYSTIPLKYGIFKGRQYMSVYQPSNHSVRFSFNPNYRTGISAKYLYRVKSGHTEMHLRQKSKANKEMNIMATYGHKIFAITGGISIPVASNITFGAGWDYTPQKKKVVNY
jgi:hypothetical protein